MSYLGVVNLIKDVSEAVNPTGLFTHSDKWKASLNFGEVDKQICLYPISAGVDLNNHFFESWSCVMGFYFQDAQDSTALDQQGLIATADDMTTEFLAVLNEVEGIELSAVKKEPSYRQMSGTYTGYLLSFTVGSTTDICGSSIVYPDLPTYPSLRPFTGLYDLIEGDTTIAHNRGKKARFVSFQVNDAEQIFTWRNQDENTIIVNSTVATAQVRVNVISYEI